jgi:hypothetical protein
VVAGSGGIPGAAGSGAAVVHAVHPASSNVAGTAAAVAAPNTGVDAAAGRSANTNCSGGGAASGGASGGRRRLPPSFSSNVQHARSSVTPQQQQQVAAGPEAPLQLTFHGVTRYAHNPHEVDWLCQQLLDAGPPGVVGFDLEWRPHFK